MKKMIDAITTKILTDKEYDKMTMMIDALKAQIAADEKLVCILEKANNMDCKELKARLIPIVTIGTIAARTWMTLIKEWLMRKELAENAITASRSKS